ncbi:MAG TPA: PPOX class F420-dependent oxidoreductase [Actinomycetes bacterium]
MDLDGARAFVREHRRAILTTSRDDGSPQMSPVAVAVDDGGHLVASTRKTALKTRNLRKRPTAWLCVISDGFYGPWIQIEGEVEIVELPDAMQPLVDYYRQVAGEHPDWDEYRAAMEREQRVLLRISPRRAGPDVQG